MNEKDFSYLKEKRTFIYEGYRNVVNYATAITQPKKLL